ncbi:MAG TPA: adenosylcobinamide-GDP ribazoletransferase [Acidimicrobiales bacterium]
MAFLTPLGGAVTPGPEAMAWFPAVGAVLGLLLGVIWWGATRVWSPGPAAAVVVAADLILTGMLHFDGLVDSADGLLPPLDRARRLEVMSAPDVGAFGVAAAGAVLLLRWSALASLRPRPLLLVGLWCASRTAMAVVGATQPYARAESGGGLASAFLGRPPWIALALGGVAAVAAMAVWRLPAGVVALAAACAAAAAVTALARRRLGGFTGDVLGALGVVLETVGLLVAAAKW